MFKFCLLSSQTNFELERELERLRLLQENLARSRDQLARTRNQLTTGNRFQGTGHHVFTSCPAAMVCTPKSRYIYFFFKSTVQYVLYCTEMLYTHFHVIYVIRLLHNLLAENIKLDLALQMNGFCFHE